MSQPGDQLAGAVFAWMARLLAAGGGGAVVAYAIFRKLGGTWLDQHFNKRLEQFKHERQTELEQFRHQINARFSRISKIHEKEFEVLPRAWELLHKAHGATFEVIKALKEYPDFNQMSPTRFDEFVNGCGLSDSQKSELRSADDRLKYYREANYWREWSIANKAQIELGNYLVLNSIFMTESLRRQFQQVNEALSKILIGERWRHDAKFDPEYDKSVSESMDRASKVFSQIESDVQKRLRYEEA